MSAKGVEKLVRRNGAYISEAKEKSINNDLIKRIKNKHKIKQSIFSLELAYSVEFVVYSRKLHYVIRSSHDT